MTTFKRTIFLIVSVNLLIEAKPVNHEPAEEGSGTLIGFPLLMLSFDRKKLNQSKFFVHMKQGHRAHQRKLANNSSFE